MNPLQEELQVLTHSIKVVSTKLSELHAERNALPEGAIDLELNHDLAHYTAIKRSLRNERDAIVDNLFKPSEELARQTEELTKISSLVTTIEREKLENKRLKKQRGIDVKVRNRCEKAALKNTWTAATFPFFEAILELDEGDSDFVEKAKQMAYLALYSRAKLHSLIQGDNELLDNLQVIENIRPDLGVTLEKTERMVAKIETQGKQYYQEYLDLIEEIDG